MVLYKSNQQQQLPVLPYAEPFAFCPGNILLALCVWGWFYLHTCIACIVDFSTTQFDVCMHSCVIPCNVWIGNAWCTLEHGHPQPAGSHLAAAKWRHWPVYAGCQNTPHHQWLVSHLCGIDVLVGGMIVLFSHHCHDSLFSRSSFTSM